MASPREGRKYSKTVPALDGFGGGWPVHRGRYRHSGGFPSSPRLPGVLAGLRNDPNLIADATRPDALASVGDTDRILIVGNGLTAADVIAALEARGHTGDILSISRRGLRSRGHAPQVQETFGDFLSQPAATASDLLRRVRVTLRAAEAEGRTWHSVLDAVRAQGQEIWQRLPVAERRRIARHVRPFWDVHRFRIAPQVEAAVERAISAGRLTVLAASVAAPGPMRKGYR